MSYENAPATKLVATHCLCCHRPLVDAKSLAIGVGPDCADKYGFYADVPEEVRREANAIIYRLAADPKADSVEADLGRLAALGFQHIVAKVGEKLAKVSVEEVPNGLVVKTPYNPTVVEEMRRIPGRRWNKEKKVNEFPTSSKAALWDLLKRHYAGSLARGPKGFFSIPATAAPLPPVDAQALYNEELARLEAEAVETPALPCGAPICNGGEGCDGEMMDRCPVMADRPVRISPIQADFSAAHGTFKRDVYGAR